MYKMSDVTKLAELIRETEAILNSEAFYKVRQQVRLRIEKMKQIVDKLQKPKRQNAIEIEDIMPKRKLKKAIRAESVKRCNPDEMKTHCAKKFLADYGDAYTLTLSTANAKQAEKFRYDKEETCGDLLNEQFACAQDKLQNELETLQ